MLARQSNDAAAFASTLRDGLRLTLFIGLPASVGLILVRTDLVAVILAGGLFSASDVVRVAAILTGYAPAVWAYAMNHTLTRAYYARGDTTTPMRVTLAFVAVNVTLNLILIWPLAEAGLAWSTAVCAILQFLTLAIIWRRTHAAPGAIVHADLARSAVWTALLSVAMAAAVLLTLELLPGPGQTRLMDALRLAAGVGVGAVVFFGGSVLARRPEPRWLLRRARPRP
jgi:putative peptidoglycan lipid II flippase